MTSSLAEVERWRQAQYDAAGVPTDPAHWLPRVLAELDGRAWTTGIESDRKQRGSAINVRCTAADDAAELALIQVREARFRPGRYTKVRKDYYLVGRNENGNAFAHPVDATARTTIPQALARIWDCDPRDVGDVRRNGDVAFVPVRDLPDLPEVDGSITLADSHVVSGTLRIEWQPHRVTVYVRGRARLSHTKRQHPTAKVTGGWWRVQVGVRSPVWGFSTPTAD